MGSLLCWQHYQQVNTHSMRTVGTGCNCACKSLAQHSAGQHSTAHRGTGLATMAASAGRAQVLRLANEHEAQVQSEPPVARYQ
jgi:hypothetical protein